MVRVCNREGCLQLRIDRDEKDTDGAWRETTPLADQIIIKDFLRNAWQYRPHHERADSASLNNRMDADASDMPALEVVLVDNKPTSLDRGVH